MSDSQQRRVRILERLVAYTLTVSEASRLLERSERQVLRMKKAYQLKGMAATVHGNTGREPTNKTDTDTRARLRELAGPEGVYREYNTCHLSEAPAWGMPPSFWIPIHARTYRERLSPGHSYLNPSKEGCHSQVRVLQCR